MKFFQRRRALVNGAAPGVVNNKPTLVDESVDATVSSDESSSSSSWASSKRVQFAEPQHNEHYESCWIIVRGTADPADEQADEQADNNDNKTVVYQPQVWYHKTDIGRFKSDVQVSARIIQMKEQKFADYCKTAWAADMFNTYLELQNIQDLEGMNAVMDTAQQRPAIDAEYVGLEKHWGVNGNAMRSRARKAMHAKVAELQGSGRGTDKALRKICRDASRTSRLFAIYIGRVVAKN